MIVMSSTIINWVVMMLARIAALFRVIPPFEIDGSEVDPPCETDGSETEVDMRTLSNRNDRFIFMSLRRC